MSCVNVTYTPIVNICYVTNDVILYVYFVCIQYVILSTVQQIENTLLFDQIIMTMFMFKIVKCNP